MEGCTHAIQISGIKIRDKKRVLVQGIEKLGGKYIGGSVYQHASTHLIIPQLLSSEKFLASCAAGKWVVTPDYVLDSVKNGSWLPEGRYELAISTGVSSIFYPVRQWREKVASGGITGAFQDWRVLLMVREPTRRAMFKRILRAGRAKVYHCPPPAHASITHVLAKPNREDSKTHDAPCYPVSHIVQHLFGSNCADMNFNLADDDETTESSFVDVDFSGLETELKDFVIKREGRPRLCFLEFLGYHDPYRPQSQATETDFSNVGCMIECGLFSEALDSIRSAVLPGLLPPASYMVSLIEYAQQGTATTYFLRNFQQVLYSLLIANPPWLSPSKVKKYFTQVLQCPRCKTGLWPFLETAISYCLSSEVTCHQLPGPALPTLLHFHRDLLAFFLKLFQGELHSVTTGDLLLLQGKGISQASSSSGSLLYGTFWTTWERSTLLTRAVKQLIQLIVQAATEDSAEKDDGQKRHLSDTLLELLSVLVEFWCQQHFKLNQNLVEKAVKDLAEHLAVVSQGAPPVVLAEMVARVPSTRLKLAVADAIFRNLCCKNGFTVGDEPLSLKKVISYLPALGKLAQSPSDVCRRTKHASHSCTIPGSSYGTQTVEKEASLEKESIPRGIYRVNAAGETLLHRACKRNQVETVLQILALPGTDINVKDHAGWTPLHEACNHGSTACVEALLGSFPAPVVDNLVGGISPLHDALLNRHMDIAKMLLEHAGSALLQQTDRDGRTALDIISSPSQREQLLHSAHAGDANLRRRATDVSNQTLLEAGCCLLAHLVFSYQQERRLPRRTQAGDKSHNLGYRLVKALTTHSRHKVTLGWTDQRAMKLVADAETLLELGGGSFLRQVSEVVKEFKGENTLFLLEILEDLKSEGEILVADL